MAELTADARNKLKSSQFGLPASRKYPMQNRAHAANAKARATQMVKKGKLAAATAAKIKAKANRILGKTNNNTGVEQNLNAARPGTLAALKMAALRRRAPAAIAVRVPATGVTQDLNAASLGARAVPRATSADNRNPATPYQEDINNYKSIPFTERKKWMNNSQGTGRADDDGKGQDYSKQPKLGGTQAPSANKKAIAKTGGTEETGKNYKGQEKLGGTGMGNGNGKGRNGNWANGSGRSSTGTRVGGKIAEESDTGMRSMIRTH